MAFTHLPPAHTTDDDIRRAFLHTSSLLADVYTMLSGPQPSCFYRINLLTGAATYAGSFKDVVVDIAIPLNQ